MIIEAVNEHNFHFDSLDTFQRFQNVTNVYRFVNGELHLMTGPFIEDWSSARRHEKAAEIMSGRFKVFCAFEGNEVVGEIMLLPESGGKRLIVDSFHVSADHRRQGIGRALLEKAKEEAVKRGASALYASACSAEETIDFYLAMGFKVSEEPIAAYAEDEPFDIQMECTL